MPVQSGYDGLYGFAGGFPVVIRRETDNHVGGANFPHLWNV